MILKRLQEKKPNYNVTQWHKEAEDRQKLLTNICEYPYALQSQGKPEDGQGYLEGPPDFIIKKKNRTSYSNQPFYQKKRGYTSGSQQPSRGAQNSMIQIVKKETLYVGQHDLGDGVYAIEIICSTTE